MSEGNSSNDDELVVGHLFDDESGSDSSDQSSDDSSDDSSSSDESRGSNQAMGPLAWSLAPPLPMFQGPQHLASDPRYVW